MAATDIGFMMLLHFFFLQLLLLLLIKTVHHKPHKMTPIGHLFLTQCVILSCILSFPYQSAIVLMVSEDKTWPGWLTTFEFVNNEHWEFVQFVLAIQEHVQHRVGVICNICLSKRVKKQSVSE